MATCDCRVMTQNTFFPRTRCWLFGGIGTLVLMPTRGAAAGGLDAKTAKRWPEIAACLISEVFDFQDPIRPVFERHNGTIQIGGLRVDLHRECPNAMSESDESADERTPFVPLDATTRVVQENGRWVVMLNVTSWEPSEEGHPIANNWKRINDYATEQEAQVAARWIEKSANRQTRPPSGF